MLPEGLFTFVKGRDRPVPFKGKYAVRCDDFFERADAKWRGDPSWFYRPLRVEFEITTKCNDTCNSCGMGKLPLALGKTLEEQMISHLIGAVADVGIPGIAITGGEPFAAFKRMQSVIQQSKGVVDVSKITSNGVWGRKPGNILDRLVGAGLLETKLFVPLLLLSIGEQTTPLDYLANIVNHVVTEYHIDELQIGISSLVQPGQIHRLPELIQCYEKLYGEFPHDRVHSTLREYLINERLDDQGAIKDAPEVLVSEWMSRCYACYTPTVGAYVLPTALMKYDGSFYTCACFNVPERLRGGNLFRMPLREILANINRDEYARAIGTGGGLRGVAQIVPPEDYTGLTAPSYCDACNILGRLYDKRCCGQSAATQLLQIR